MSVAIRQFAEWFRSHSDVLSRMSSDDVASEVAERLAAMDERLGVEVERPRGCEKRRIILTAFSDRSAFSLVRAIADEVGQNAEWNILALKPPRGFEFFITLGGQRLRADALRFRPLPEIENGFEFLVPDITVSGDGAEEAAWLIAETGVGEELAGGISHLEFGNSADLAGSIPITEFASALQSDSRVGTVERPKE